MGDALNLFPSRAAIGQADASGNVYMTPEFSRALAALVVRVGGPVSNNLGDIALELATAAHAGGGVLAGALEQLDRELAQAVQLVAQLAEVRKHMADLEAELAHVTPPTDWEHPGKIGAAKANSGAFTRLAASDQITSTLADGTAPLVVASGTVVDKLNVSKLLGKTWAAPGPIGATTPDAGTFSTVTSTSTAAEYGVQHMGGLLVGGKHYAGALFGQEATLYLAGGFGFVADPTTPANSYFHLTPYGWGEGSKFKLGVDGALTIAAGFGCNGKSAQPAAALGAAATDAASTQALANNIRAALIAMGIGS